MGEQNELERDEAEPTQELVEDLEVKDGAEGVIGGITGGGRVGGGGGCG